jgi:hypothetical protein
MAFQSVSSGEAYGRRSSLRSLSGFASALLPVVRRTLQMGNGPPWVVAVLRSLGIDLAAMEGWTIDNERRARLLAVQAAQFLASPRQLSSGLASQETVIDESKGI